MDTKLFLVFDYIFCYYKQCDKHPYACLLYHITNNFYKYKPKSDIQCKLCTCSTLWGQIVFLSVYTNLYFYQWCSIQNSWGSIISPTFSFTNVFTFCQLKKIKIISHFTILFWLLVRINIYIFNQQIFLLHEMTVLKFCSFYCCILKFLLIQFFKYFWCKFIVNLWWFWSTLFLDSNTSTFNYYFFNSIIRKLKMCPIQGSRKTLSLPFSVGTPQLQLFPECISMIMT